MILVDPWTSPEKGSRYEQSPDAMAKQDQKYFDDCYEQTVEKLGDNIIRTSIMRTTSRNAADLILDNSVDFVFIDADHTYEGVLEDIKAWLPKIKKGGWIGGHDYGNLPRFPGVKKAVDESFPYGVELKGDCTWFRKVDR
jgi:hypothetical protein